MAKLNLGKIMGEDKSVALGKQNFNAASMKLADSRKKSVYINMDLIDMNEDNRMSMDTVNWLVQDIRMQGLQQPLVVEELDNGRYKLYAGHQRLTAIRTLRDNGEWNADNLVEVKITDIDKVNVPAEVKRTTKEKMVLRGLNIQRDKTDADLFVEVMDWKEIYADLRANGVKVLEYGVEDGEVKTQQIAGVKTQTLVAEQVGISHAQVAKFDKVANKGSQELIDALKSGKIQVATASEIAGKPIEEQQELLSKAQENKEEGAVITGNDIILAEHKINSEKQGKKKETPLSDTVGKEPEDPTEELINEESGELISEKVFKGYFKDTFKYLRNNEVRLDEVQMVNLLKYIRGIEKIIVK